MGEDQHFWVVPSCSLKKLVDSSPLGFSLLVSGSFHASAAEITQVQRMTGIRPSS